ncbi:uncharacterized protein BYT42DRAFT_572552 [Radiomyces spectabilis]|uniref:uncharacterized protein n=1 Tax=Radiomyces spectabilis TaxID=64574 RepID=UPI002220972C|nr:uncharacterized protein BYT42DRAFT_572552 [Radiomyces spectabilis]KAI8378052.1 hypothetical protein BYT42DRAFT_572552 [Radiomyces spectabilis]
MTAISNPSTPTVTTNQESPLLNLSHVTPSVPDVVDDAELLAILGLPAPTAPLSESNSSSSSTTTASMDPPVVLDWDDMPELLEEEDDENDSHHAGKKRSRDDEDDLFATLDFVEVPMPKKPATSVFVDTDVNLDSIHAQLLNDQDIRLALELIAS